MSEFIGPDIKAVLFDWDDTLIGTIENKWAQHKHVARTWYNKELLDEDLRRHWGKPLHAMVKLLYETGDVELAITRNQLIRAKYPKILFDHTLGVVTNLRAAQKIIGIVTAHTREGFNHDLNELGIPGNLFDYTQTSTDTEFHKPDPKVFEPAVEWLGRHRITPSETMYIGDGILDMEAARGAGLRFIGVETGLVKVEQFHELGAVAVKNLSELIPVGS
jgi:phosphoglycolate phosphatase